MPSDREPVGPRKAGAFDIRTFIALLIGIYGLVLVLMGLFSTSDEELARADDLNINLWAGIAMVLVAACMQAWAVLRPVVVPPHLDTDGGPPAERRQPPES